LQSKVKTESYNHLNNFS